MRKLLFISLTHTQFCTGGSQCSKRNLESLKYILGEYNIIDVYQLVPYNKKNLFLFFIRLYYIFKGYMGGLTNRRVREILDLIKQNNYSDIFVDSSLLGLITKKIKKIYPDIKIYTYFHNCEVDFLKQSIIINKDYLKFYWILLAYINEKIACKYSNKISVLNKRDFDAILKYYKKKADYIIPITLGTSYFPSESYIKEKNENKVGLFIGSYFYGNVQGIKWFCEKVLPNIDIVFYIAGSGMENLRNDLILNPKIKLFNNVKDLSPLYEKADFVVLPILSGSGMKVKTAESLMYGKYIIGTPESFVGYDINDDVARVCESPQDFINAISSLTLKSKFNQASYDLFLKKYSFNSSIELFKKMIG